MSETIEFDATRAARTIAIWLYRGDFNRAAALVRETRNRMDEAGTLTPRHLAQLGEVLNVLEGEGFAQVRGYWIGQLRQQATPADRPFGS